MALMGARFRYGLRWVLALLVLPTFGCRGPEAVVELTILAPQQRPVEGAQVDVNATFEECERLLTSTFPSDFATAFTDSQGRARVSFTHFIRERGCPRTIPDQTVEVRYDIVVAKPGFLETFSQLPTIRLASDVGFSTTHTETLATCDAEPPQEWIGCVGELPVVPDTSKNEVVFQVVGKGRTPLPGATVELLDRTATPTFSGEPIAAGQTDAAGAVVSYGLDATDPRFVGELSFSVTPKLEAVISVDGYRTIQAFCPLPTQKLPCRFQLIECMQAGRCPSFPGDCFDTFECGASP